VDNLIRWRQMKQHEMDSQVEQWGQVERELSKLSSMHAA
jgi:hypothetical protein